jgi:hypothetical protein
MKTLITLLISISFFSLCVFENSNAKVKLGDDDISAIDCNLGDIKTIDCTDEIHFALIAGRVETCVESNGVRGYRAGSCQANICYTGYMPSTDGTRCMPERGITLLVSPAGNDKTGDGTKNKPWQTIQKARDYLRINKLNQKMTGDIFVNIEKGDYYIEGPIVFGPDDSGSNGHSIVYRSVDGIGQARIHSGMRPPLSWDAVEGKPFYRTQLPRTFSNGPIPAEGTVTTVEVQTERNQVKVTWSKGGSIKIIPIGLTVRIKDKTYRTIGRSTVGNIILPQGTSVTVDDSIQLLNSYPSLFENDMRARLARSPNHSPDSDFAIFGGAYNLPAEGGCVDGTLDKTCIGDTWIQYKDGEYSLTDDKINETSKLVWWGHAGRIDKPKDWGQYFRLITSIDTSTLRITSPGSLGRNEHLDLGDRYYIEGFYDFLDAPGEFFYDSNNGWMYYYPRSGHPNNLDIRIPISEQLIQIQGSVSDGVVNPVHHLKFVGFALAYTKETSDIEGAISMGQSHHIEIRDTRIYNVGYAGVFMDKDNSYNTIYGCWIHNTGVGGIIVINNVKRNSFPKRKSEHHLISNCKIHNLGEKFVSAIETTGVLLYSTNDSTVSHCEIFNSGRYATSLRGHYSKDKDKVKKPRDSMRHFSKGNKFEYILARNCMSDSGDGGVLHAAHCNGKDDPEGKENVNFWNQILISDTKAHDSMKDIPPNGIFIDHKESCVDQGFSNIQIEPNAPTDSPDAPDWCKTHYCPYRTNANPEQTLKNVSWKENFNPGAMKKDTIGLNADFPMAFNVLTVDDHTYEYSESDASWVDTKIARLYKATGRYHSYNSSGDTQYAQWQPTFSLSGNYEVYIWKMANYANASAQAPYVIYHSSGNKSISVNQQTGTEGWVSVGTYHFLAGKQTNSGYVRLFTKRSYGKQVRADAVKFELRSF